MSEPLVSIDSSEIREGKLEELKSAIGGLVRFVDASEAKPLAYEVNLNGEGSRMTVLQVHPDSASMEFHMKVAAPAFRKSSTSSDSRRWTSMVSRVPSSWI